MEITFGTFLRQKRQEKNEPQPRSGKKHKRAIQRLCNGEKGNERVNKEDTSDCRQQKQHSFQ